MGEPTRAEKRQWRRRVGRARRSGNAYRHGMVCGVIVASSKDVRQPERIIVAPWLR